MKPNKTWTKFYLDILKYLHSSHHKARFLHLEIKVFVLSFSHLTWSVRFWVVRRLPVLVFIICSLKSCIFDSKRLYSSGLYCATISTVSPAPLSAAAACSCVASRRSIPFTYKQVFFLYSYSIFKIRTSRVPMLKTHNTN